MAIDLVMQQLLELLSKEQCFPIFLPRRVLGCSLTSLESMTKLSTVSGVSIVTITLNSGPGGNDECE